MCGTHQPDGKNLAQRMLLGMAPFPPWLAPTYQLQPVSVLPQARGVGFQCLLH